MAVQNVVKSPSLLMKDFSNQLKGTEWEGIIPNPNSPNIKEFGGVLFQYQPVMNRFLNYLVNKIAFTKVDKMFYTNPLAFAKKGLIPFGETIELIWVEMAKAYGFCSDKDDWAMLKQKKPDIAVAYVNRNREDQYQQTINEAQLQSAFSTEQGLSRLVDTIINSMYSGNDVAEFVYTLALIADALDKGYIGLQTTAVPTTKASTEDFLVNVREVSNNLLAPSTRYNAAGVTNTSSRENQRLLITAQAEARAAVKGYGYAFQLDEVKFAGRTTIIPQIPNHPEIVAIICDDAWINVYDNLLRSGNFYNDMKMYMNYWLTVFQTFYLSPFHNAIALTTATITPLTKIEVAGSNTYTAGAQLTYTATLTPSKQNYNIRWELGGNNAPSTNIAGNGLTATLTISTQETAENMVITCFNPQYGITVEYPITLTTN